MSGRKFTCIFTCVRVNIFFLIDKTDLLTKRRRHNSNSVHEVIERVLQVRVVYGNNLMAVGNKDDKENIIANCFIYK